MRAIKSVAGFIGVLLDYVKHNSTTSDNSQGLYSYEDLFKDLTGLSHLW